MPCYAIKIGNDVGVLCCGRSHGPKPKPCFACGELTTLLCDGPPRKPGMKTCDRAICAGHSVHVDPDSDFCFDCQKLRQQQGVLSL